MYLTYQTKAGKTKPIIGLPIGEKTNLVHTRQYEILELHKDLDKINFYINRGKFLDKFNADKKRVEDQIARYESEIAKFKEAALLEDKIIIKDADVYTEFQRATFIKGLSNPEIAIKKLSDEEYLEKLFSEHKGLYLAVTAKLLKKKMYTDELVPYLRDILKDHMYTTRRLPIKEEVLIG